MSLSTATGTKLGEKVVTDVNANVAMAPTVAQQVSPELAILFDKSIVAKPLGTPEVCSVHVKHPEYQYRWVNRSAKGGLMYQRRKSTGWTNATLDDVDLLGGDVSSTNGEITAFDLILMKCPKEIYQAAIKHNMLEAFRLTRTRGVYMDGASSDVNSDKVPTRQTVAQEPYARTGKAEAFIPANAEQIIDDSVRSGRVEEVRATVDKLRKKQHEE